MPRDPAHFLPDASLKLRFISSLSVEFDIETLGRKTFSFHQHTLHCRAELTSFRRRPLLAPDSNFRNIFTQDVYPASTSDFTDTGANRGLG